MTTTSILTPGPRSTAITTSRKAGEVLTEIKDLGIDMVRYGSGYHAGSCMGVSIYLNIHAAGFSVSVEDRSHNYTVLQNPTAEAAAAAIIEVI